MIYYILLKVRNSTKDMKFELVIELKILRFKENIKYCFFYILDYFPSLFLTIVQINLNSKKDK